MPKAQSGYFGTLSVVDMGVFQPLQIALKMTEKNFPAM
jgi:hypothetical protein